MYHVLHDAANEDSHVLCGGARGMGRLYNAAVGIGGGARGEDKEKEESKENEDSQGCRQGGVRQQQ